MVRAWPSCQVIQPFCCRWRSRLWIGAGERSPIASIIWRIEGLWLWRWM